MKILILGGGAREHAIAYYIAQNPRVTKIFTDSNNAGILQLATQIVASSPQEWLEAAQKHTIDLTIVGPEKPLAMGVVDLFRENGLKIVGHTRKAARLETSKIFAKDFMTRWKIPTPRYKSFSLLKEALEYLPVARYPAVIKADGLAAGKGVTVAPDLESAQQAVKEMMGGRYGEAGHRILVEDCNTGPEISCFVAVNGLDYCLLPYARDFKRLGEGGTGPNTGGMGAVCPVDLPQNTFNRIERTIIRPTLIGACAENMPLTGILYIGLMLTSFEPRVIEYNVRFGDPETQALLPLLDSDLLELFCSIADNELQHYSLKIKPLHANNIVLASKGYPGAYQRGCRITGIPENSRIFHAGTRQYDNVLVTDGGRVMSAVGLGNSPEMAREQSLELARFISYTGKYFRQDIE